MTASAAIARHCSVIIYEQLQLQRTVVTEMLAALCKHLVCIAMIVKVISLDGCQKLAGCCMAINTCQIE